MDVDLSQRTQQMIADAHRASGFYEGPYTLFASALLRQGDIFVDAGAHVGYFTLLAASIVGPSGHVYAFEPEPRNFNALERNIAANRFDNVTAIQSAVGNQSGTVSFYFNSDNDGGHAMWDVQTMPENVLSRRQARRFDSPIVSLDTYFSGRHFPIRFMKIDVEGSERDVIEGARNLFETRSVNCVMWERNAPSFEKMGYDEDDLRGLAAKMGYRTAGFVDGRLTILEPGRHIDIGYEINLFFFSADAFKKAP